MFLRGVALRETGPVIRGPGIHMRTPTMADYPAWAALREESRAFLAPWEPTWAPDELTRAAYRRRLKRYARDLRDDVGYPFLVFRDGDGALATAALDRVLDVDPQFPPARVLDEALRAGRRPATLDPLG